MSEAKQEVTQTENGVSARPSKKRSCINHCKRFWWLHALIFAGIVVLVVCLVIFVGVPRIAQSKMDAAQLDIQRVDILQTTPNSYHIDINSTITTDGAIHANVYAFDGTLSLADDPDARPAVSLHFPPTNANKHQDVQISQNVQIGDKNAFKDFNIDIFQKEKLAIKLDGKTKVKPSGLSRKSDVNFRKTLEINGLNLLKGTNVTDGNVDIAASPGTPNFRGTADIPNASVFTLDIGNATFDTFGDEQKLGSLSIHNLVLRPGKNTFNVEAELDQVKILSIIGKKPYCDSGIVPFKLVGTGVEKNGQQLEYFAAALASANQTVPIDIGSILKKTIPGFQLSCSTS